MLATLLLFAEDAPQQQPGGDLLRFAPIFLVVAFVFIIMLRGSRRQDRERQAMLANLEKNDKVLTAAGIYGTVISVHPTEDEVVVKVDDNTRLKMVKAAIQRNITKEQAAAAPKADDGAQSTAVTTKPNG
jgi:preprotein translocase subunit YajC